MDGLAAQAPSGWMSTARNTSMACQGYGTLWSATVAPNWPKPCANRWSDSATARATPGVPLRRRSNWARGCPRSPTRRSTDSSSPPEAGKPARRISRGLGRTRSYWKIKGFPNKTKVISCQWGSHGVTLAAMSASGITNYWPCWSQRFPASCETRPGGGLLGQRKPGPPPGTVLVTGVAQRCFARKETEPRHPACCGSDSGGSW